MLDRMARRVATIIAGVYRFEATVRREGRRGRRIAIPAPIVRGLRHMGWDGRSELRVALGGAAWTANARKIGNATVVAVPPRSAVCVGDSASCEVWPAVIAPRQYLS